MLRWYARGDVSRVIGWASPMALASAAALAVLLCTTAHAADLRNVLTDHAITSWGERDGLPSGGVNALAQDREGYLWVGTDGGLFRFDGVRFIHWEGGAASQNPVRTLHLARDGSLWVGWGDAGGVSQILDGTSRLYGESEGLPRTPVNVLIEDDTGRLITGSEEGLFALIDGRWQRIGEDQGLPHATVHGAFASSRQGLYVGTTLGVFRRALQAASFVLVETARDDVSPAPVEGMAGRFPRSFVEDASGNVLANDWNSGFHVVGASTPILTSRDRGRGSRLLFDRRQNLWVGTIGQGLWRVHPPSGGMPPVVDRATSLTGLLTDGVSSLLEDREGNIWVGTTEGLSRLTTRRISQVTDYGIVTGIELTPDGIWVGTLDELLRFSKTGEAPEARISLGQSRLLAMHADEHGTIWVATDHELGRIVHGSSVLERLAPVEAAHPIDLISSDAQGGVWVYEQGRGLLQWTRGRMRPVVLPEGVQADGITLLYTDRKGQLWIGLTDGRVATLLDDGQPRVYGPSDGLDAGISRQIYEDHEGTIWLAATEGIARLVGDRFQTVLTNEHLPIGNLTAIAEDDVNDLWLGASSGVVRIAPRQFDEALAHPNAPVQYSLYNRTDGLGGLPLAYNRNRRVVRAPDGRLWFVTSRGLSLIDPAALRQSRPPAPTTIEYVTANEQRYGVSAHLSLPARTSRLEIAYSRPDLTAPLRTRFRYRLEGFDQDWVDAGVRRQAFYTNLPPREYRFHVVASNNDGTWAEPGAVWDFSIKPMPYQTTWFRAIVLLVLTGAIWGIWQLRVRQIRHQFSMLLGERMRLSRELHDTLLQSLVGVALQFDAVASDVEASSDATRKQFLRMRKQVEEYIREARQSIWDLRSPRLERRDLVTALREVGEHATARRSIDFALTVSGQPRPCPPKVEEQLLRIGQEAVLNAVRHASASHIQMELHYDDGMVSLRVADDGCGFDRETVVHDAPEHYGLISMRERAEEVGGRLEVTSEIRRGTQILAVLPLAARS